MRYDQLPTSVKRKVDAAIGKQPGRTRSRATAKGEFMPMRCVGVHGCGEIIRSEAALERHHGGRFEVILGDEAVHAVTSRAPDEGEPICP